MVNLANHSHGAVVGQWMGFDVKWNMGFMNDYLTYIKYDPFFRSHHHSELTFSLVYAYSEKFILVFSHDEVVHGKATLAGKMPGKKEDQLANLRLTYAYMMTHPGKKLLFMGQDLAEFDEWNEMRRVEWELLNEPDHAGVAELVKDLNHLYRTEKALFALDDSPEGFEWVNAISGNECYLTYLRKDEDPEDLLLVVANFAGVEREIRTGVPYEGKYKEIFNTDDVKYGGTGIVNSRIRKADDTEWDDRRQSITVKLAPLSAAIFRYVPYTEEELAKVIEERIRKMAVVKKASSTPKSPANKTEQKTKAVKNVKTPASVKKEKTSAKANAADKPTKKAKGASTTSAAEKKA